MAKKEKKVTSKENNKETKNKKSFFKGLKAELKKVIWPTPKQLVNNTVAVITIVLITAVIVFILDLAFESLNKYGIDKIKESIQTMESTTNEDNDTAEGNTNTTENEATDNENTTNTSEENVTATETTDTSTDENQNSSENSVE